MRKSNLQILLKALLGFGSVAIISLAILAIPTSAFAQFGITGASVSYDLSDAVSVDEADGAVRAALDRVKAYVAEKQWDEAVESLRQVQTAHGNKLIKIDETPWLPALKGRWMTVGNYCNLRIAALPAEGLELYRNRVDPAASKLYQRGISERNAQPLRTIVAEMFASSWGDKALYALGEIALEQGDFNAARGYWESISRELKSSVGGPEWLAGELPRASWLAYPDTTLDLASVRARLVWVSILEGDYARATAELATLKKLHLNATGRMAGVEGKYVDTLTALLTTSSKWPARADSSDWPTFAGNAARNRTLSGKIEIGRAAWEKPIELTTPYKTSVINNGAGIRVGESFEQLLSCHPITVDNLLLWNDESRIYAADLATGQPPWHVAKHDKDYLPGEIFPGGKAERIENRSPRAVNAYGVPRFTMTAIDHRLYARMGSPITARATDGIAHETNDKLVCVDLTQNGKLLWQRPETPPANSRAKYVEPWLGERWSFEGSPVADGNTVYVAMRYADVRPQIHVAALDAFTGQLRWRRLIASAESPTRGQFDEITTTLLSRDHDTLYLNTNLGAVAAITTDGQIKWITHYARSNHDDDKSHFYRDLNPCVVGNGLVYAAPADNRGVFAFDTLTGQMVWYSAHATNTVHLLGVSEGKLVATGNKIWIFDARNGKALYQFPDSTETAGMGRGLLADGHVYWPTRTHIRRFDLKRMVADDLIDLDHRGYNGVTGGNLLAAPGRLIITTADKIYGFSPQAGKPPGEPRELTRTSAESP